MVSEKRTDESHYSVAFDYAPGTRMATGYTTN
jgi:hypothetical protein